MSLDLDKLKDLQRLKDEKLKELKNSETARKALAESKTLLAEAKAVRDLDGALRLVNSLRMSQFGNALLSFPILLFLVLALTDVGFILGVFFSVIGALMAEVAVFLYRRIEQVKDEVEAELETGAKDKAGAKSAADADARQT